MFGTTIIVFGTKIRFTHDGDRLEAMSVAIREAFHTRVSSIYHIDGSDKHLLCNFDSVLPSTEINVVCERKRRTR